MFLLQLIYIIEKTIENEMFRSNNMICCLYFYRPVGTEKTVLLQSYQKQGKSHLIDLFGNKKYR